MLKGAGQTKLYMWELWRSGRMSVGPLTRLFLGQMPAAIGSPPVHELKFLLQPLYDDSTHMSSTVLPAAAGDMGRLPGHLLTIMSKELARTLCGCRRRQLEEPCD